MEDALLYPELSLKVSADALIATFSISDAKTPRTMQHLTDAIAQRPLKNIELDPKAISTLLNQSQTNLDFSIKVAQLVDAELKIAVSSDKMTVSTELIPERGGKPLSEKAILAALLAEGILESLIVAEDIRQLLVSESPTIVARGRDAQHGGETIFEERFFIEKSAVPTINPQDFAEYFETKHYVTVEAGDELIQRIPPTEAAEGLNVLGKVLKAKKGKLLKFKKYPGTMVCEENEDLLIATMKGHPVLEVQGARVDPTLVLAKANLNSGNIDFDGSVLINGDVLPQVKIVASGDIFVKGTVENANLQAGNNIIIGGGVISESTPKIDKPPKITTQLCAGFDIHAKFLNLTRAKAGQNLIIQSYAMNSELTIGHSLLLGEKGGKGALIGGHTIAKASITVKTLGSTACIKTNVECGNLHELKPALHACESLVHKRIEERRQLKKILKTINADSAPQTLGKVTLDRSNKISRTVDAISKQIQAHKKQRRMLRRDAKVASKAFVQINKQLFPQVTIKLNDDTYIEQKERAKTRLTFRNEHIHIE